MFVSGAGSASAQFANTRVTTNTRIMSFVPLDASAAAFMVSGASAHGWYHDPSENDAGSHLLIRTNGKSQTHESGIWQLYLVEPVET